jgi:hypothetical protein
MSTVLKDFGVKRTTGKHFVRYKFRAWLHSLPPEQIVGYANEQCGCPLYTFLRHKLQRCTKHLIVTPWYYSFDSLQMHQYTLPLWAKLFIEYIDADDGRTTRKSITAREALTIMETL